VQVFRTSMYDVSTLDVHREKIKGKQIIHFKLVKQSSQKIIKNSHLTDSVKLFILCLNPWDRGPMDLPIKYSLICEIKSFTVSVKSAYVHAPTFFWQGFQVLQNEGHDFPTIDVRCIHA
jgi:hypothetical protein